MKIATTFHQHRVVPVFAILLLGIAGIPMLRLRSRMSPITTCQLAHNPPSSLQERKQGARPWLL